ncbi:unnamed protein product [Vicia faba]|uniref:TBCC domain-containing protein 1 n=1 Tax=Vicia faba TaxID=3906 RepID=A0AAV1AUB9_VICFA|nr:unnamed protein product [Vicia faba]
MTESPTDSRTPPLGPTPATVIHPRRVPFEHGLLPIPRLIFSDPAQTLISLKQKLLELSSNNNRVDSAAISESLQISVEQARLVVETLVSVLPAESESDSVDVHDLVLFLYIQSYKRLLPRTHKDSAAVADVWPSTSAFDGYLSALTPLQLVRSNSKRFMPSQGDEEAHQLSYLQKHLANIVSLLAEPVEGESEESLVLTMDRFEHLGFLFQYGDKGLEGNSLSQSSPFFANSDPNMPAVPAPASQVHDWLLQNIASALERIAERTSSKENGPVSASDQDVAMTDASTASVKVSTSARGASFIEGISKSSYAKHASDIKGSSVKVLNCHESAIYILAPLRYATIYGCSDTTVVIGAVGKFINDMKLLNILFQKIWYYLPIIFKTIVCNAYMVFAMLDKAVRVEHCERVHVIVAAKRICIANCRECVFFLGVNQQPLIVGDNHKLQVAPYNTFYSQLEEHVNEVGVLPTVNRWDEPITLGMVDPHDSLSHPAGVSDVQAESASKVDPDQFTNFVIPNWLGESIGSTKYNPFTLPEAYMASQQRNENNLGEIRQLLREAPLEESRKRELSSALHVYFRDWLYASGNIRQLYYLQGD